MKKMISQWLDEHGDPEIEKFVSKNLAITENVRIALENKGWKASDLAVAMEKSSSEVSKWLSGMHNLTLKSIIKMEMALGTELILTESEKEYHYVNLGIIKDQSKIVEAQGDYKKNRKDFDELELAV